jgi:hypothetical protein
MMPARPSVDELRRGEAMCGARPDAVPTRPKMRLLEWRPMARNMLRGFCVVELPSGLVIRDIAIHEKAGKCWANLPARPILDAEGRHISNHAGHKQYAAVLGWRDRDLADRFSAALVELVRAEHPSAFDETGQ